LFVAWPQHRRPRCQAPYTCGGTRLRPPMVTRHQPRRPSRRGQPVGRPACGGTLPQVPPPTAPTPPAPQGDVRVDFQVVALPRARTEMGNGTGVSQKNIRLQAPVPVSPGSHGSLASTHNARMHYGTAPPVPTTPDLSLLVGHTYRDPCWCCKDVAVPPEAATMVAATMEAATMVAATTVVAKTMVATTVAATIRRHPAMAKRSPP